MRISKLLPRILADVVPVVAADVLEDPTLTPEAYAQVAKDAINAVIKAFNDEWVAENPKSTPPITTTV